MKIKRYSQRYRSGNREVWVEFCCIICISGLLFSRTDLLVCPLIHLEWPSLLGWVHDFKYL